MNVPMECQKARVQGRIIKQVEKAEADYSLDVVNRYKENLVHVCAANDCVDLLELIVARHGKQCLERKSAFGWTALMQAIRNENVEAVKFLIKAGVDINDFSFLGTSALTLASAISVEMFELLYNNSPSALEYAAHDDISPLCIAALKNDERLFGKLVQLGCLDYCKPNAFSLTMMKQSTVPEIAELAKVHLNSEDYWNDVSDIEQLLDHPQESINKGFNDMQTNIEHLTSEFSLPSLSIERCAEPASPAKDIPKRRRPSELRLQLPNDHKAQSVISPKLSYRNKSSPFAISPNTFVADNDNSMGSLNAVLAMESSCGNNSSERLLTPGVNAESPSILQRCQDKRPPNLKIRNFSDDSNATLSFTPQFTPSKSPNLPVDVNEDDVFDDTTPTPPKYKTPPRGIILEPNTKKLIVLLKKFGLKRHVPLFIEQEVDWDLFLTLTDNDLVEIGISKKSERLILLSVVEECKGRDLNALLNLG